MRSTFSIDRTSILIIAPIIVIDPVEAALSDSQEDGQLDSFALWLTNVPFVVKALGVTHTIDDRLRAIVLLTEEAVNTSDRQSESLRLDRNIFLWA